jgi:hypothetical protein
MTLTSPQPIASWAAADEGAGSTLPRRPKKRGPYQLVPVILRQLVERLE